jgi:hypothetical protein
MDKDKSHIQPSISSISPMTHYTQRKVANTLWNNITCQQIKWYRPVLLSRVHQIQSNIPMEFWYFPTTVGTLLRCQQPKPTLSIFNVPTETSYPKTNNAPTCAQLLFSIPLPPTIQLIRTAEIVFASTSKGRQPSIRQRALPSPNQKTVQHNARKKKCVRRGIAR